MNKLLPIFLLLFGGISWQAGAQNMQQHAKLTASDRGALNAFGNAVSISGNYAIIAAVNESENAGGLSTLTNAGAAYLFERNKGQWTQVQKITASDRAEAAAFGSAVAISGNYAIVGALADSLQAGAAYIFERNSNGQWVQIQKLYDPEHKRDELFGQSVSIHGNYAIIGAGWEDEDETGANPLYNAGAAYIYERQGNGRWDMVKKIAASDRAAEDLFGFSVAINGNYAMAGSYWDDEDANGGNTLGDAGSVYVFERKSTGWQQVQKITAANRALQDYFGFSISLSGNYALIGAYLEDEDADENNAIYNAGAAYLFQRDANGIWRQAQKLTAQNRQSNDYFGFTLSLSGKQALVGTGWEDNDANEDNTMLESGAAYLFEPNDTGKWVQVQKLVANDRDINDLFAYNVSIHNGVALIGAQGEDEDAAGGASLNGAGSAYIFCRNTASTQNITACDSFSWNGHHYTGSGTYTDTIPNMAGCDSLMTLNLTINTVDIEVTGNGTTLAAQATDARYQWIDCNNGFQPLTGDTSREYTASASGSFAVVVSQHGCTDTSACYTINLAGIIYHNFSNLQAYPNPTGKTLHIQLGKEYRNIHIMISDAAGREVALLDIPAADILSVDIPGPAGVYFVTLTSLEGAKAQIKVVKP